MSFFSFLFFFSFLSYSSSSSLSFLFVSSMCVLFAAKVNKETYPTNQCINWPALLHSHILLHRFLYLFYYKFIFAGHLHLTLTPTLPQGLLSALMQSVYPLNCHSSCILVSFFPATGISFVCLQFLLVSV